MAMLCRWEWEVKSRATGPFWGCYIMSVLFFRLQATYDPFMSHGVSPSHITIEYHKSTEIKSKNIQTLDSPTEGKRKQPLTRSIQRTQTPPRLLS